MDIRYPQYYVSLLRQTRLFEARISQKMFITNDR
jgi:hypothetical protein